MRVVVFGYGELGAAAVDAARAAGARVAALVLPSNRDGPDVELARGHARLRRLPVLTQPARKQAGPFVEQLRGLEADLLVVWSYSMILPPAVLDAARLGGVNVHGGLLPEYRGGHVMQWAIINGEAETGVTLHHLDEGIDTGPVIARARFPIGAEDDALSVRRRLKAAGERLLARWLAAVADGSAPRVPQDEARARYYRLRTPEDGRIDWSSPGAAIANLVRALVAPWPGAFTFIRGKKLVVRRATPVDSAPAGGVPGRVLAVEDAGARVTTGKGDLWIRGAEVDGEALGPEGLGRAGVSAGTVLG
jgi:methionyl-tRNA formyltransferase